MSLSTVVNIDRFSWEGSALRETANYALFHTDIGRCGIAWRRENVCAVTFPTCSESQAVASLRRCAGDLARSRPPAAIHDAISRIESLLAGDDVDLSDIAVDLGETTDFERSVYAETVKVRRGETTTYGAIAKTLRDPRAARAVGRALGRNPTPIIVPCHRVLAAGGRSGGFSGAGGIPTKLRLLQIEGASVGHQPSLFDQLDHTGQMVRPELKALPEH